jgi:MFS family permease
VVAAAFLALTVSAGFGFYSLSTYSGYLTTHTSMSLTTVSTGSTLYMFASGAGGIAVARLARRLDMRVIMAGGTLLSAATVPLIGLCQSAWQLWPVYLLYGLGASGISMIPASTLVMRWFAGSPGRAMALATTGMSVGGALVAPLVAQLVADWGLPTAGWFMAAATLAVVIPLVIFVVASPPAPPGRDLRPGSGTTARPTEAPLADPRSRRRERRLYAAITLSFGLLMLSQVGAVTHLLTLGSERHIGNAALALSILAGTSVVGRLLGIPLLPRIGTYRFSVLNALLQAAAMVVIAVSHGATGLFLGAVLLGATVGNTVVLLPLNILNAFGIDRYATTYARANFITAFGVASGPLLLGAIHDHLGGYLTGLLVLGCGSALAAVLLAVVRVPDGTRA